MVEHDLGLRSRQKRIIDEKVDIYREYTEEYALELGAPALRHMVTVVQRDMTITDQTRGMPPAKDTTSETITSKPYDYFEGQVKVPDYFVPTEACGPGNGDKLFFLEHGQAAPVFAARDKSTSVLIANKRGKARIMANTERKREKLARKVKRALPREYHPITEEMVSFMDSA